MEAMNALESATMDDLMGELAKRYKTYLFVGCRPWPGKETSLEEEYMLRMRGSLTTAIGLAMRAKVDLVADARAQLIDELDEDETDDE